MKSISCPNCKATLRISDEWIGRRIACSNCKIGFAALPDDSDELPAIPNVPLHEPNKQPSVVLLGSVVTAGIVLFALILLVIGLNHSNSPSKAETKSTSKNPRDLVQDEPVIVRRNQGNPKPIDPDRIAPKNQGDPKPIDVDPRNQRKPKPDESVSHLPPSMSALLDHPWWKKNITRQKLDKILNLMTTHGEGVVFFDFKGNAVWISGLSFHNAQRTGELKLFYFHVEASGIPDLAVLDLHRKFVPITAGVGNRYTQENAIAMLQDFLNLLDYDELKKLVKGSSKQALDELMNQKGIEDLKKEKAMPPIPNAKLNIPIIQGIPPERKKK
jgi:hypothetical protein